MIPLINLVLKTCNVCYMNKVPKQQSKSNRRINTIISKPFQKLYIDCSFMMKQDNFIGWCLAIDHFTKYAVGYLIKNKRSETIKNCFQKIINDVNNISSHKIENLVIHTDNGSEFKNSTVLDYLAETGIPNKYGNAYSPEEQGVIERLNSTIKNDLRNALCQTPEENWTTIFYATVDSYNRTLHSILQTSPHEFINRITQRKSLSSSTALEVAQELASIDSEIQKVEDNQRKRGAINNRNKQENTFKVGDMVLVKNYMGKNKQSIDKPLYQKKAKISHVYGTKFKLRFEETGGYYSSEKPYTLSKYNVCWSNLKHYRSGDDHNLISYLESEHLEDTANSMLDSGGEMNFLDDIVNATDNGISTELHVEYTSDGENIQSSTPYDGLGLVDGEDGLGLMGSDHDSNEITAIEDVGLSMTGLFEDVSDLNGYQDNDATDILGRTDNVHVADVDWRGYINLNEGCGDQNITNNSISKPLKTRRVKRTRRKILNCFHQTTPSQ